MFRMLPQWTWSANIWASACGLQMSGEAWAVCTRRGDVSSLTCHVVGIRVHRLSLWYLISADKWQICMEISNFSMDPKNLIPPSSSEWNLLMLCITSCETIPGNRTHLAAVRRASSASRRLACNDFLWNSNCMACLRHCFSSWSLRRMSSFSSPRPCVLSIMWLMSEFDRLWKHQNNPVCTKGSDKRVWLQIML